MDKLPIFEEGAFNLTCKVADNGLDLAEPEKIIPRTDREWYLTLNGKLHTLAEVQKATFTLMEKGEKHNEETHTEIIKKIDAISDKMDTNTKSYVHSKPYYFLLSVLVLILGFFFIKTASFDSWVSKHETEFKLTHPPKIEQKTDITPPQIQ